MAKLTPDQKRAALFERWLSPQGVQFAGPEAEKTYKENVTRIKDAIEMKKLPDRVPVCLLPGFFPVHYAGMTVEDVMYDYDKCSKAFRKFTVDFQPDGHIGSTAPGSGKFLEMLDYKLYAWPGHGVAPEHPYQCREGEYMKADEYDALIDDPSYFFSSVYFPRVFGALQGFQMLPALHRRPRNLWTRLFLYTIRSSARSSCLQSLIRGGRRGIEMGRQRGSERE